MLQIHHTYCVPILCVTDFSSPIINSLVEVFNNESIEDYLGRSYLVVTGKASSTELPCKKNNTTF